MIKAVFLLSFLLFNYLIPSNNNSYVVQNVNGSFRCRATVTLATDQHLPSLIKCVNQISEDDRKKIVIFPKEIQSEVLKNDIKQEKLVVALSNDDVVIGYKKLFYPEIMALYSILRDEIRCIGFNSKLIDFCSFCEKNGKMEKILMSSAQWFPHLNSNFCENYPVFYNGTDYVCPEFRCKGICKKMYELSICRVLQNYSYLFTKGGYVGLVYGLTESNDYNSDGSGTSRTPFIIQEFVKGISKHVPVFGIVLYRYEAFMPKFNKDGNALPDEESVPGYGNFALFHVGNKKGQE